MKIQFLIFVFFLSAIQLYAQQVISEKKTDTLLPRMYSHACAPSFAHPHDSLSKYQFHRKNYQGLGDLLDDIDGAILQQIGDPLTYSSISIFNSLASHLTVSMNGTSLNDHIAGAGNLYSMNPESIHTAQVYIGSDAAIIGGSAGPHIYLQENMYSSPKPFSRLWYVQGGYDLIGSEGILSQNIDTNLNIHGNFRRLSSGGMLRNTGADIWNTRLGIRHLLSPSLHYSAQWLFTNHGAYHNGGVIGEYQNPISADVMYDNYFQRRYMNHIQFNLTANNTLGMGNTLFINLFAQHDELETRGLNPFITKDSSRIEFSPSNRFGVQLRHEIPNMFTGFSLMNEIGFMHGNHSIFAAIQGTEYLLHVYSYGKYAFNSNNVLRCGLRYVNASTGNYINPGISFTSALSKDVSFKLDLSRTTVLPTLMQQYMLGAQKPEYHQLAFISFDFNGASYAFKIQPFYRSIDQSQLRSVHYDSISGFISFQQLLPISDENISSFGMNALNQWTIGSLSFQADFTYTHHDSKYRMAPRIQARLNAEYTMQFGSSTVTLGSTARIIEQPSTMRYIPYISSFAHDGIQTVQDLTWNGLDIHVSAILGNARIRASVINVLSSTLMDIMGYPIQDNIIRLSLNWSFFD